MSASSRPLQPPLRSVRTVNSSEALRVALDVTPLLGPPTGVHQTTAGLIEALRRRSDVMPSGYALSARASARRLSEVAGAYGISVIPGRVPAALCHRSWSRCDLPRLRRVARGTQVIHGTNYTVPLGGSQAGRRKRRRPGHLITVHDLGLVTRPEWCTPGVRRMAAVLRRAAARGAHLHVTTRAAADEAAAVLRADPARIHVVPLGVRSVGAGDAEAARRLVGADRYVLALGAVESRKGLTGLPRAVASLDGDVRLVVAGPPGADEPALTRAVKDSGLDRRYVRLGAVDADMRADLICGASVLAYPSLLEGFGLPPLEAALAGIPVAATAVGALPELLRPEIRLASPGDDHGFAEVLTDTLAGPASPPPSVQDRIAELTWGGAARRLVSVYRAVAPS